MEHSKIFADLLLINGNAKNMREFNNADSVDVVYNASYGGEDLAELKDFINAKDQAAVFAVQSNSNLSVHMSNSTIRINQL